MLDALRAEAVTPEGDGYRQWDDMAVELEAADFLYALVRLTKPRIVVESGTGRGIASAFIAQALADNNNRGWLYTYEPLPDFQAQAVERLRGLPVTVREGDSIAHDYPTPDLVFLDSGPNHRPREIVYWVAYSGPPLVIHDANRYKLPGGVYFDTPRGLWVR